MPVKREPILDKLVRKFAEKVSDARKTIGQFKASAERGKKTIPEGMGTVKDAFKKESLIQKKLKEIYEQKR